MAAGGHNIIFNWSTRGRENHDNWEVPIYDNISMFDGVFFNKVKLLVIEQRKVAVWVDNCFHTHIAIDKESYFTERYKYINSKKKKINDAIIAIFKKSVPKYTWDMLIVVTEITYTYVQQVLFENTKNILDSSGKLINDWDAGTLTKNHFAILHDGWKDFCLEYSKARSILNVSVKEYDEWQQLLKQQDPQHLKDWIAKGAYKWFLADLKEHMLTLKGLQNNEWKFTGKPVDMAIEKYVDYFGNKIKSLKERYAKSHPDFVIIEKKQLSEAALKRQQKREERKGIVKRLGDEAISKIQRRNRMTKAAYDNGMSFEPQEIEARIKQEDREREKLKTDSAIQKKKREQEDLERKKKKEQEEREHKALRDNDEYRNGQIAYDKLKIELENGDDFDHCNDFEKIKDIGFKLLTENMWFFSNKWDASHEESLEVKHLIPEAFTQDFQELRKLLKIACFRSKCSLIQGTNEEWRNHYRTIKDNDAQEKYNIETLKDLIQWELTNLKNPYYRYELEMAELERMESYEIAKNKAIRQWELDNPYTSFEH